MEWQGGAGRVRVAACSRWCPLALVGVQRRRRKVSLRGVHTDEASTVRAGGDAARKYGSMTLTVTHRSL